MNLTKIEKKLLRDAVTGCKSVFEWGCGESTEVISGISSVSEFFSVDSDLSWINSCKSKNLPTTNYLHVDIQSPEGSWGYPGKNIDSKYFLEYPLKILQIRNEFDVVFVDGRFRVACASAAYFKLKSDGILLIHDYARTEYHTVELIYNKLFQVDNLAVFRRSPGKDSDAFKILSEFKDVPE